MPRTAILLASEQRAHAVVAGTSGQYTYDKYVTADVSAALTLYVSHLRGEMFPTGNTKSDRVYYLLRGTGRFDLADGTALEARQDDAVFIPAGVSYKMSGDFDAVVVNAPALDPGSELKVERLDGAEEHGK
jgi:mannose-6-phosphate isomerase-like protein (cupin superfamily)